jgi:hypothetical protein
MAKYMLLILEPPTMTEEAAAEAGSGMAEMTRYARELREAGKLVDTAPLGPFERTKRVRRNKRGKLLVTDGPFAESKEVVSGYFIVEARDRREAVALAKKCPHVAIGFVEVREVVPVPLT